MPYVGFTGRADGMTPEQYESLAKCLHALRLTTGDQWVCLHNDGEGSDQTFATLAKNLGFKVETTSADLRPMPRNRELAAKVETLYAAPPTEAFVKHSGSWATIRYALKAGKRVILIRPNGEVSTLEVA